MKKSLLLLAVALMFATGGSAQSLKGLFNKVSNKVSQGIDASSDFVDDFASALTSKKSSAKVTDKSIEGTWTYKGVACEFNTDDMLLKFASEALSTKIEDTANGYMAKFGINPNVTTVTFNSDGTCVLTILGQEVSANYTLEDGNTILFSVLFNQINVRCNVFYEGSTICIMSDADKLLSIVKGLISQNQISLDSEAMSTLSTMSSLIEGYDGMKLGLKLQRK